MAEAAPNPAWALEGVAQPGHYGRSGPVPGVVVAELPPPGLAMLTARKERRSDLTAAAQAAFGVTLPKTPRRVESGAIAFIWSGPDRWLVHCPAEPRGGMEAMLARTLGDCATVVDQSHARLLLGISGRRVRDALAKGVAIDLHPSAFQTGDTAITSVAHIGVQLWQTDNAPTYIVSVARSLAGSLWDWLTTSGAEYGLELARAPRASGGRAPA